MDGLRGASVDGGAAHETLNTGVLGEGRSSAPRRYSGWGRGGGRRRRVKTYSASWQALGPGEIGQASDEGNCCGDLHGGRWREVERGEVEVEVEVEVEL
jgi:hypothetical protein